MAIVYAREYYGTPKDQIPALEAVTQATVTRLFDLCQAIGQMPETSRSFGDVDYTITRGPDGLLLLTDHSAGWWAIIQTTNPYPHQVAFKVFSRLTQEAVPAKVKTTFAQGKADWKWLQDEFLYGRADMYLDVTRTTERNSWYGPNNHINFTHPLMMHLHYAVDEIEGRES